MAETHVERNIFIYRAAISACEKRRQWQQALEFFERMGDEQVEQNVVTCKAAISDSESSCSRCSGRHNGPRWPKCGVEVVGMDLTVNFTLPLKYSS